MIGEFDRRFRVDEYEEAILDLDLEITRSAGYAGLRCTVVLLANSDAMEQM